eukprot:GHVT01088651.1.p1 GENE.GHVT01088651.1~~GHVT01088651.1.p1  ORF type:complete len:103 (+),score=14.09 GHVT01088651.1:631-939(+)
MASPASFSTLNAHTCRPPKLRSVTVTAPATTANMGCGFDCMGMAVDVWNDVTIQESDQFKVTIEGEGAEKLPTDETNFVRKKIAKKRKNINRIRRRNLRLSH